MRLPEDQEQRLIAEKKLQEFSFDNRVKHFRRTIPLFADKRTGNNKGYSIEDAALGAFSVFFTQSPSFLSFQKSMLKNRGQSNAQSLFGMQKIPCDNHIRDLMDAVPAHNIFPVFTYIIDGLQDLGYLNAFRSYNDNLLCALDATQYFSSKTIHCQNGSTKEHKDGSKPDSHKTLYQWLEELDAMGAVETVVKKRWTGKQYHIDTYRFVNQLPLRDGQNALPVNGCELTTTSSTGHRIYKNAFATNFEISKNNAKQIVADGRCRWKIENENNNVLKTKGYHLEHNFGHGKNHLSALLLTFNLLAFLFHTGLKMMDSKYAQIRQDLPTRKTFFDDIRALTRYIYFDSWDEMLTFMAKGLELLIPDTS